MTQPPPSASASPDDLLWRHLKTLPAFRALLRSVEARFYQVVELPHPILDLGCGDGDFVHHTFKEYGEVPDVGVDPWWESLRHTIGTDLYGSVAQCWGDNMPFPDEHFASAFSNSVLEHIPDIQPVLNETSRVLQTGGRFLITMPNDLFTENLGGALFFERWGMKQAADRYRRGYNFIARHAHTEGIEWWAEKLANAGMAIERWQYYFSVDALHVLEAGHVQGLPSVVSRALTGHWILAPTRSSLAPTERWVRPFYLEQADETGTCVLIVARKVANHPIEVHIPEARPFVVSPDGDLIPDEGSEAPTGEIGSIPVRRELESAPVGGTLADVPARPGAAQPTKVDTPRGNRLTTDRFIWGGVRLGQLLLASFGYTVGRNNPWIGFFLWLVAIGLTAFPLSAFRADSAEGEEQAGPTKSTAQVLESWLLGGSVFLFALVLRSVSLSTHPFVLSGTEADFGLTAANLVSGQLNGLFDFGPLSNPALPLYLQGVSLQLFGRSALGIRILSPLIGALTVFATFWFGRKLWSTTVGLTAAIVLAGSHTHIHYSRLGLTNVWDPFFVILFVGFFGLAWRSDRRSLWLLAGGVLGLSSVLFTAGRALPVILGLTLVLLALFQWGTLTTRWRGIASMIFLAVVIALPMVRGFRANPTLFNERYNQYGVRPQGWVEQAMALTGDSRNQIVLEQVWDAFFGFNGGADSSLYYGVDRSLVNVWVGLLLIVGLLIALAKIGQIENQLLVTSFFVVVAAGVLMIGTPASHRYLVGFPIVALFAGLTIDQIFQRVMMRTGRVDTRPWWLLVGVTALMLLITYPDIRFYFGPYRTEPTFSDVNTEVANEIGEYLQTVPPTTDVFLVIQPRMTADFPNIRYFAESFTVGQNLIDVTDPASLSVLIDNSTAENKKVILLPEHAANLESLQAINPDGSTTSFQGELSDILFTVVDVSD